MGPKNATALKEKNSNEEQKLYGSGSIVWSMAT